MLWVTATLFAGDPALVNGKPSKASCWMSKPMISHFLLEMDKVIGDQRKRGLKGTHVVGDFICHHLSPFKEHASPTWLHRAGDDHDQDWNSLSSASFSFLLLMRITLLMPLWSIYPFEALSDDTVTLG